MNTNDITTEFVRGSGPGGQHRNKATTGVRLTHTPTGIQATATERRSRTANLKRAHQRLTVRVTRALAVATPRIPTKPTKGSVVRRQDDKRRRGARKALRRAVAV
jgi:protein subunit release factor B